MSATPEVEVFTADPKRHAFVTWVIAGDAYVLGALTLANSINAHGSKASKVVMISSDVSEDAKKQLAKVFDLVTVVPVIDVKVTLPPFMKHTTEKEQEDKTKLFSYAFTKLNAFKLTQFEKVALLDADTVCVSNPDSIFQVAAPAGICTGVKNDNAAHGKPIDIKVVEKAYKDAGFCGNVYLLKPNTVDYERAIKQIAVKIKITSTHVIQTAANKLKSKSNSAFAGFDDDDDEDEDAEGQEQTQVAPREDVVVSTRYLTKEDIESTRFDDDKKPAEKAYPFDVLELPEQAPLGFAYEPRKSNMNPDECLFVDLYMKQWKHLHPRFGLLSWQAVKNKPAKAGSEPVFLHFTQKAWNPAGAEEEIAKWADLVYFDIAALNLAKDFEKDAEMIKFVKAHYPSYEKKVELQKEGGLVPPQPQEKPAPVEQVAVTAIAPEPEAALAKTANNNQRVAIPKQPAWGKPQ